MKMLNTTKSPTTEKQESTTGPKTVVHEQTLLYFNDRRIIIFVCPYDVILNDCSLSTL